MLVAVRADVLLLSGSYLHMLTFLYTSSFNGVNFSSVAGKSDRLRHCLSLREMETVMRVVSCQLFTHCSLLTLN